LSLFMFVAALQIPHRGLSSSGAFPLLVASVMFLSILRILWKDRKVFSSWKWTEEIPRIKPFAFPREVVAYAVVLILYILLLYPLHFWVSSYLFLVGSFLLLKGAKPFRGLIIGAIMLAVIWLLFEYIFRIILW
jgi:hypothetical protein